MKKPELLPCPFCGTAPVMVGTEIRCANDLCFVLVETVSFHEKVSAIRAWDKRAPAPKGKR